MPSAASSRESIRTPVRSSAPAAAAPRAFARTHREARRRPLSGSQSPYSSFRRRNCGKRSAAAAREILPPQTATRIPGAPEAVVGLVNVRGALLTLFDGHRLLGQEPDATTEGAILVVDHGGRRAGLAVSEVSDLLVVPPDSVEPRDALPGVDPRWVQAVGHREGRHFVLLDLPAILAPVFGA